MATAMLNSVMDEAELLRSILEGSEDAFRVLVERYQDRLYALAHRVLGNRLDAEEVVQETFLRAFRNLVHFQAGSSLYTWLYRIALNAAVDLSKRQRRRRHVSLDDGEAPLKRTIAGKSPDPSDAPVREEIAHLVREGVDQLPDAYRQILILREYSEMSYEQLGEVLRLPKGTVESRLFRARMKLKDWLVQRLADQGMDPDAMGWS